MLRQTGPRINELEAIDRTIREFTNAKGLLGRVVDSLCFSLARAFRSSAGSIKIVFGRRPR